MGDKPLLAQAVDRIKDLIPEENIYIITNQELVKASCDVLPDLPSENIVGEPMGRDTAAAIALGAALIKRKKR